MPIPKYIVHLLSGGVDSVTLLYDRHKKGYKIHCALVDYKQRHVQEIQWAKHHVGRLGLMFTTFDLPQLRGSELTDGSGGVIVPNRNPILLSHAVNLAVSIGAESVTFAANKDDYEVFPDCRKAFVDSYNSMLRCAGIDVEVCAPYLNKTKRWIVNHGRTLGIKFNETWSCYRGGIKPCGKCEACKKREGAMKSCGL